MGKFDGFLICSDVDRTFRSGGDTEKINSEAVRYFTENGGRFTFATGRMIGNLRETGIANITNAPICLCNGGLIFDNDLNKTIYEQHTDFSVRDFCEAVSHYGDMKIHIYKISDDTDVFSTELSESSSIPKDILDIKPIKFVCVFKTPEDADGFKKNMLQHPLFKTTYITKSWPIGVEFNSNRSTKGTAIRFIKEYLGDIHTSIGVGDYENDIPLIKNADLGVAVGNALDCVKNEADLIVKPASEYAIADLISIIENKL